MHTAIRYRRAARLTWELADDRAVILDAAGSTLTTLNPVGTVIWHNLDRPRRTDELVDDLAARFPGVDRRDLQADAAEFIAELERESLVVIAIDED